MNRIMFFSFSMLFAACASDLHTVGKRSLEVCADVRMPSGVSSAGGITWTGGSAAYSVSDERPSRLFSLDLSFSGEGLLTAAAGRLVGVMKEAVDSEAVEVDRFDGGLWVAHEVGGRILKYFPGDPGLSPAGEVKMPDVRMRKGRGLESLAISADGKTLFTCNEESLLTDGPRATRENGTYVRIFRFTRSAPGSEWRQAGQWAYLTEKISGGAWKTKGADASRNGVSGLCLSHDGTLLVLERDFSTRILPRMDCRIYEVSFTGATDITGFKSLSEGGGFVALSKRRVFSISSLAMYEGFCRGPRLGSGEETFLLCSDGGRGTPARILQLKAK